MRFPIKLEQYLMEGSYQKVVSKLLPPPYSTLHHASALSLLPECAGPPR